MEVSTISKKMLRDLCMNSRTTITEFTKKYNLTRRNAKERILSLERELGLHYTLELDYRLMKFDTMHIFRLNFNKKPKPEDMRSIFAKSRVVQFAATTKGDFDMLILALAKNSNEYFEWEIGLSLALAKYGVQSHSSEVTVPHLGFFPLNNDTIKEAEIDDTYKNIILNLNTNSRMSMRELSKKIGLSEELTKYHVRKHSKDGIIKRYTSIVTKPPLKFNIAYFVSYTVKEGIKERVDLERKSMYWKKLNEFPLISEFQLMLSTTGSDASFTWACYQNYEEGLRNSIQAHKHAYRVDSPMVNSAVIMEVVKGAMPLRNVDTKELYDTTLGASMK